jgi:MFS family permease
VRYVRDTRPLGLLIGSDAAFVAFASAINPVEVVLVRSTLQGSSAALGVVLSAWGVGMIASGTVVQRAADRYGRGRMVAFGAGAQAVAFLGMGLSGTIAAVVAFSAVGGIGNGLYGVLLATSVQERIAEAFQARVSGLIEALMTTATACAFVAGGALAAAAGPRAAYLFAGGGSLTVIAYATARLRQDHPGARTRVVARLIVADKP